MKLFLIGYRGTGKSTVAARLAAAAGCPALDTDAEVVRTAGRSIAEIFAEQGEPAFRDGEVQALARLAARSPLVLACGGGIVLRPENRALLADQVSHHGAQVIWLKARPETLAARLSGDPLTAAQRPALTSRDPLSEIRTLLEARTPLYESCATWAIDTDGVSPEEVAAAVARRMHFSLPSGGVA